MFEKDSRLSPRESRKRLLIAESELNRARLMEDAATLKSDVQALVDRVKSVESIAATAATLVSGLAGFRGEKSANGDGKSHWVRRIIRGAGLVSTLWRAFRPRGREQNKD